MNIKSMMQDNFDPFFAEVFHPYDLSCGVLQLRYIRNFGLIKVPSLLDVLSIQQERPRFSNLIKSIKLGPNLHLLSIERFRTMAYKCYLDDQEITEILQLLSPSDTVYDKTGYPYATYNKKSPYENIILIDEGREVSPIVEDLFRLMMSLTEEEFLEMNYGNPEYDNFVKTESIYTENLQNKMNHYKAIEEKNRKTARNSVTQVIKTTPTKTTKNEQENMSNEAKDCQETENFNKLNFIIGTDFNKLNFRKSPKIVKYNIFQLLELIGKIHNKIIIFHKISELIRKNLNINNINLYDKIILIKMNIDKNIRKNFTTINTLWYDICYYYKTGHIRQKYKEEIENITELENKALWLTSLIQKLNYHYCLGDKEGIKIILNDHALELENEFKMEEISKYYQMANWNYHANNNRKK